MALTVGTGPFGARRAGRWNFDPDAPETVLYLEEWPRRVRATIGGQVVVDTRNAKLLHESDRTPVYLIPDEDVADGLLREIADGTVHDDAKGERTRYDLVVTRGDDASEVVREAGAYRYLDPPQEATFLHGLTGFVWDAVDHWYEDGEEVFVHPRDPYHRVDVLRTDDRVEVVVDGTTVASSTDALVLYEAGMPPRYYLPRLDVDADVLRDSDTVSHCPYKGDASYHHVEVDGQRHEDLVWYYHAPLLHVTAIADRLCFYNEKVEVRVNGETETDVESRFN